MSAGCPLRSVSCQWATWDCVREWQTAKYSSFTYQEQLRLTPVLRRPVEPAANNELIHRNNRLVLFFGKMPDPVPIDRRRTAAQQADTFDK